MYRRSRGYFCPSFCTLGHEGQQSAGLCGLSPRRSVHHQAVRFTKESHDTAPSYNITSDAALNELPYGGGWMIDCGSHFPKKGHSEVASDLQAFVGLILTDDVRVDPVPVEVIDEAARGDLVLCARATSNHPALYNFLDHYRALGVDHFHINYMFTNTSHVQKAVGHNAQLFHYGGPATIVEARDITWKFGGRDTHLTVLTLYLQLNECIHRYKYSYKYAMIIDLDEFLVLNASLRGYPRLADILDNAIPHGKVAVKFCRMHYSRACPSRSTIPGKHMTKEYGGPSFFSHWKRDPNPDCVYGKTIIRPHYVKITYTHYPWVYEEKPHDGLIEWPTSVGYFQHWSSRQKESNDMDLTACDTLVAQSENFMSNIWFS